MNQYKRLILILNLLLRPFNLLWSPRLGLTYKYNLLFGEIGIVITKDLSKVLEFLHIDQMYLATNQQFTMSDFLYLIKDCKYVYLPNLLTKPEHIPEDLLEFYDKLIELVKLSITGHIKNSIKIQSNFLPPKNRVRIIYLLDREFNQKGEFCKKIKMYDAHINKMKRLFIKNKFNGNLVMRWAPELKPGKELADTMAGFRSYVEEYEHENFNIYVKRINVNELRVKFIYWYYKMLNSLNGEFDDLPF